MIGEEQQNRGQGTPKMQDEAEEAGSGGDQHSSAMCREDEAEDSPRNQAEDEEEARNVTHVAVWGTSP